MKSSESSCTMPHEKSDAGICMDEMELDRTEDEKDDDEEEDDVERFRRPVSQALDVEIEDEGARVDVDVDAVAVDGWSIVSNKIDEFDEDEEDEEENADEDEDEDEADDAPETAAVDSPYCARSFSRFVRRIVFAMGFNP